MDVEPRPPDSSTWPALAIVLVLGYGILSTFTPLRSSRPPGSMVEWSATAEPQDVPARLWQDPFNAVTSYRSDKRQSQVTSVTTAQATDQDRDAVNTDSATRFQLALSDALPKATFESAKVIPFVMLVLVPGGIYPNDAETRVRWRHALMAGLAVAGYAPFNPDHLGVLTLDCSSVKPVALSNCSSLTKRFLAQFSRHGSWFGDPGRRNSPQSYDIAPTVGQTGRVSIPFEFFKRQSRSDAVSKTIGCLNDAADFLP